MMSRNGMIVMGVLVVLIIAAIFTKPPSYKPAPIRVGNPMGGSMQRPATPAPAAQTPPKPAQAPAPTPTPTPVPTPPPAQANAGPAMPDFELLQDRFGRDDPFSPLHPPAPKPPALPVNLPGTPLPGLATGVPLPATPIDNSLQFRLTAISMNGGEGMAIINNEVFRVGDSIKNYVIQQITPDGVRMKSDVGEILNLRIHQEASGGYSVQPGLISNIQQVAPTPTPAPTRPSALPPAPAPRNLMKEFDSGY